MMNNSLDGSVNIPSFFRSWLHYMLLSLLLAWILLADTLQLCFSSNVYIVYMGRMEPSEDSVEVYRQTHQMLIAVHSGSVEEARRSHIYSYSNGFKGFAAKLTEEQVVIMSGMSGVVSVFPNSRRQLHTTHSWDFMRLATNESMAIPGFSTDKQDNVIVGFIDTGIWPESPSFDDYQMRAVPSKWKGRCQSGEAFTSSNCNRKVIGARYYLSGHTAEQEEEEEVKVTYKSPRDSSGHGTHTASTAAGRYVEKTSYKGLASGGARGGASMARIAVYKACWNSGCYDADLLAAFDDAINDGVDIISLSLGPNSPQGDYFSDAISIASFHATNRGIVVVASAGNNGIKGSATNLAPWLLTVAAGSTDRDFSSQILLADRTKFLGESLSIVRKMKKYAPVIAASKANAGDFTPYQASFCLQSSLNKTMAEGKILVCRQTERSLESKLAKSTEVKNAGGVGMILIDEMNNDVAVPFNLPAASIGLQTGDQILSYAANNTRKPRALILPTKTVIGSRRAPRIASFSSKGPNSLTPEILKPDITGPGLNILAAWSPSAENLHFNILSGTSMACPHVTGVVALIKSVHPTWSHSAIKSALMTTARTKDDNGNTLTVDPDEEREASPFDYGSGFMNPTMVLNPGLVYDARPQDYDNFLCSIGYDNKSIKLITGGEDARICHRPLRPVSDLNYPSIVVWDIVGTVNVTRTVMNVGGGSGRMVYRVEVVAPPGIEVNVCPDLLIFSGVYGEEISFVVIFQVLAVPPKLPPGNADGYVFGSLTWKSWKFRVTSPLVVRRTH